MVELTAQQAISRLRLDESRMREITNQLQSVARLIEELRMTRVTLEQLPEGESTGFLPLGGVMIPVKTNPERVKMNIGSSVFVEQNKKETIKVLQKREEALDGTMTQLQETLSQIEAEALQIRQKLSQKSQSDVPVISG